jgi:hypothetical protein
MKVLSLAFCKSMFGEQLTESSKDKIINYLNNPTNENFDEIKGLVITPSKAVKGIKLLTIWQAGIKYSTGFPLNGRSTTLKGKVIDDFPCIPTPDEVINAIHGATIIINLN